MEINENKDEREKLFAAAIERKRLIGELKEHKGFELFCEQLETQIKRRTADLIAFPSNIDKIPQNIYTSGEIAGIKLALEFADTLLSYAQATIDMEKHLESIEKEEKNGEEA